MVPSFSIYISISLYLSPIVIYTCISVINMVGIYNLMSVIYKADNYNWISLFAKLLFKHLSLLSAGILCTKLINLSLSIQLYSTHGSLNLWSTSTSDHCVRFICMHLVILLYMFLTEISMSSARIFYTYRRYLTLNPEACTTRMYDFATGQLYPYISLSFFISTNSRFVISGPVLEIQ